MRFRIWILIFFSFTIRVNAQDSTSLGSIELTNERTAKLFEFSNAAWDSEDSLWYVGKEYPFLNTRTIGTPFFFDAMELNGSLVFNGKRYSDLSLFYDLVKDVLVLHSISKSRGSIFIILNKAWIEEFSLFINGKTFRFLSDSYFNYLGNKLPEGFLDVCYDKDLKLLFKYSKELRFEANNNDHFRYNFKQNMYLIKGNNYYEISKKSKFLSLFPDYKKQIKTYLRKTQIQYKNASRSELISLIEYCEKLS